MKLPARFDLNLLRIFDAIYARSGVSAAARHLHLSQPAISHALARLREAVGDPLFVRQGNSLVPTATAHAIAASVREALRELDAAFERAASFDPQRSEREFRIGVRLAAEMPRLPALFARIRSEAPRVSLASVTFRRRDLAAALSRGELDVALDVALPQEERLHRICLGSDSQVVVARRGHPRIGEALSLDTYLALDHVVASVRPHGPGIEDLALEREGLVRRIAVRCQHATTAWHVAATSDLLYTLPRLQAEILGDVWPMQQFSLPVAIEASTSNLYWHPMSDRDPGLAWLRGLIVDMLGEGKAAGHSET